jgi:CubicO group peptidase (beta-lactamase class C family)
MVMVDGQVQSAAAVGFRRLGSDVSVDLNDRWHLGGISKPVTATMIGRLIEAGQMDWDDTVAEFFPDDDIHPSWKSVTLKQLLTDTAGAPENFPNPDLDRRLKPGPQCTQARRTAVLGVLAKEPSYPPGQQNVYSNVGYTIVGAMAEARTGVTFEQLIEREVFSPLKLNSAGFGPPLSAGDSISQPVGHRTLFGRKMPDNDQTDNSAILSPSATMHMTLADLGTFANEHRLGEIGQGTLLSPETYKRLHAPIFGGYACGWLQTKTNQSNVPITYWHNGSNTLWYAYVAFIPGTNTVIAITSNDGDGESGVLEIARSIEWPIEYFEKVGFPKKSPYAAIRWNESQPEVLIDQQWYTLVSIGSVPVAEIIQFSQQMEKKVWRKRFEEDLVELMIRMGKPPGNRVDLTVKALGSENTTTFENVSMSEEYRKDIRNTAEAAKEGAR